MVDPVTGGFIGWSCGKLADSVLKHLASDKKLSKEVDKAIADWAKSLSKDRYVEPKALFPEVDPTAAIKERPEYCALQANLVQNEMPEKQTWHSVFMESWQWVRHNVEEPQPFFLLDASEASKDMERLAEATYDVCVQYEPTFKKAVITKLDDLGDKIDDLSKYLQELLDTGKKKKESLWPEGWLPFDGPKVSEPFAGREEELEGLGEAMEKGKGVVAVVGMAGQGKSCLAGEWYKRGARPEKGVGLFWRKVYEAGYTFDRFLDEFYQYLTGEEIDRQRFNSIKKRANLVDGEFRDKPCWIVLDGVERWLKRWAAEPDAGVEKLTIDDRAGQEEILDKFLKGASWWQNGSRLLLTTRAVPSALDGNPPVMIGKEREKERRLEDLRPEEAVELLEGIGVKGDKEIMRQAAGAYGNHPYAVHVLGVLIHDLYGGGVSRWEEVRPLEEKKKGLDVGVLFEKIIEHRKEDLGLLGLAACSVGPAPVEMLGELLRQDEGVVRKRLSEFDKWQMVEFKGMAAEQHSLVRKFMTERIGEEGTKGKRLQIARWWAEREVPARPIKIEEIRPLLKAAEHLIAAGEPDAATDILYSKWSEESYYILIEWLDRFGYMDESIRINGAIIRAYINLIEKENRRELRNDLASCYNNRGNAYWAQGRLSEAIADYGKAIEIREELVEKEGRRELRNDLAMCYNNRGVAYSDQGRLSEAIGDYGKGIEIYKELVEKENRRELRNDLASCYNNRGAAYWAQGRLSEAIADYGKAIEIYKELVEKENRRELRNALASCYNNRGIAYRAQGRLSEAIADYGKAIGIREELVEKENRRELRNALASCYNNRGLTLTDQGRLSEAIGDYGKAIEIREELVEKENRRELRNDLASCYNNRGLAYWAQGRLKEAIEDYDKAIEIREELVEKEGRRELRNDLASCYNNRGNAYWAQGRLKEAIADYGKAIEIYEELVEKEDRCELRNDLASCYNNRGTAYWAQGRLSEAIGDYGKAIEIREELVEKENRRELRNDLAMCYNNRGNAYRAQGRLSEAIGDYGKAIEIREELVEKENRRELRNDLAMCYNNRGNAYSDQGRLKEAIADYGKAIEIYKELVEKEDRRELRNDLESSLFNRAVAYNEEKKWKKAREDIEKGVGLLRGLIEEGQRHVIGSFLKTAGFRCKYAKELGEVSEAAEWANAGMRWFMEEVEGKRENEMLLQEAAGFAEDVGGNKKLLLKNGLDEKLFERTLKRLGEDELR